MTSPPAQTWRQRLVDLFAIDLRTMALFRAAFGIVLFAWALNRLPWAEAFFTDWGTLPREALVQVDSGARFSFFLVNGQLWFAWLVLGLTALCALALAAGYRTRLAVLLLFLLAVSAVNRNPLIVIGGDSLILCLLFWSLFLPLGARWSVDAALSRAPPPADHTHRSWASAGMVVQVLSVYFFSAILKDAPEWWPDGTALYYTMELERYASPLGHGLLPRFPGLMQALSWFVWFLEWLGPLLALSPWANRPLRFAVMLCLMAMHVGFILFMEIGHFPYVSLCSLTLLLGGWFWERASVRLDHGRRIRIFYDDDCGFCRRSCLLFRHLLVLPNCEIEPASTYGRARKLMDHHWSWVVIDHADLAHTKWRAWVALVRHSMLFGWVGPFLGWSVWERPGEAVYHFVANRRAAFAAGTAWLLAPRDVQFTAGRMEQAFAAVVVFMVLAWNLGSVGALPSAVQALLNPPMRLLRIDQKWDMFAPFPSKLDGWAVFPGRLEDGAPVDVLRPDAALSWERPAHLSQAYPNIMWRTYQWRILREQFRDQRLYYGRYLCREWNWDAAPGRRLESFEMVYIKEISVPPGEVPTLERVVAWKHDCRPRRLRKAADGDPDAPATPDAADDVGAESPV